MTVSPKKKKTIYAGLSITPQAVELAVFSVKGAGIEQAFSVPLPQGVFDADGDQLQNPAILKELISQLLKEIKPRPSLVHLSVPGTLLRMVEMPKMDPNGLYLSLSSEAERYKTFDNTEAVVDFVPIDNPHIPTNQQQLVFGAVRSDSLSTYLKILRDLHVKVGSVGLEPVNALRALAGNGVLDSLIQQIGTDAYWGMIFVESTRVRFSLWQCNRLVELRETAIDTSEFAQAGPDSIVVEDMLEEIRRTTKNAQPTLWLTHKMPVSMADILSSRIGSPFQEAPMGNAIALPTPLQLSTVGSALSSVVTFPFDLDISEGLSRLSGTLSGGSSSTESGPEDGSANGLIPAGVVAIVLALLGTGILYVMGLITGQQIPQMTTQRDSAKMEVSILEARHQELKRKAELDQSLLQMVNQARIRNRVYVALTDDLTRKTPQELWIQSLKVGDALEIVGKGMNHKSIIHFAQSFDDATYTKAVLIDSIKEGRLNGTLVYDFKISGGVSLSPSLLTTSGELPAAGAEPASSGASGQTGNSQSGAGTSPKSAGV